MKAEIDLVKQTFSQEKIMALDKTVSDMMKVNYKMEYLESLVGNKASNEDL